MAAPMAAPMWPARDREWSRTPPRPNSCRAPTVALNTPPALGDVFAEENHVGIARHFSGRCRAPRRRDKSVPPREASIRIDVGAQDVAGGRGAALHFSRCLVDQPGARPPRAAMVSSDTPTCFRRAR